MDTTELIPKLMDLVNRRGYVPLTAEGFRPILETAFAEHLAEHLAENVVVSRETLGLLKKLGPCYAIATYSDGSGHIENAGGSTLARFGGFPRHETVEAAIRSLLNPDEPEAPEPEPPARTQHGRRAGLNETTTMGRGCVSASGNKGP